MGRRNPCPLFSVQSNGEVEPHVPPQNTLARKRVEDWLSGALNMLNDELLIDYAGKFFAMGIGAQKSGLSESKKQAAKRIGD